MRKIAFLFACLLLTIPCGTKADVNLAELVKEIQPAVVTVTTYDEQKNLLGQGSGFFVDKQGHLITNYHILKEVDSALVKTSEGKQYPVKMVVAVSQEADLIKLSVDIPEEAVKFAQVTNTVPEVAERVLVIGSPLGLEQTVSEGTVSAVREIPTIGKIFQISAPISPDSSGAPVVNMKGQVTGVATFLSIERQNLNFVVSGEQVLALKSEKKARTLAEWTSSVSKNQTISANILYENSLRFLGVGEYEKALDYLKKSIEDENAKNFAEACFYAGYCYGVLGRWQEAIEAFKQAIHIKPELVEAHNYLGIAYGALGRYQEAIDAYKKAIQVKPDYAPTYNKLAVAYGNLGLWQEALEACNQAISINPDYVEAYNNLGAVYGKLGQWQQAIDTLKQAVSIKPDYHETYNYLGMAYAVLGQWQEALEAWKQAIHCKPDYVEAHNNLGIAYGKLNRWQKQIEAFEQAISIKPDYAEAHYNLGMAYLSLGDRASAIEEHKILKTLDKDLANKLFNSIYKYR